MFGRKRVTTGLSNTVGINVNTNIEAAATAIGFNFEAVGNSINGKQVVVKLHKIRYSPYFQTASAVTRTFTGAEVNLLKGLTVLDSEFTLSDTYEAFQDFFDTQAVFGIDQDFAVAFDSGANNNFSLQTKEVELEVYLPFTNINAICYYNMSFISVGIPSIVVVGLGAELTWSYEMISPQEYQALKFDWQSRTNYQIPPGKLIVQ
jgi:hypothetical protein